MVCFRPSDSDVCAVSWMQSASALLLSPSTPNPSQSHHKRCCCTRRMIKQTINAKSNPKITSDVAVLFTVMYAQTIMQKCTKRAKLPALLLPSRSEVQ